jgi:hypothetical protein
VPPPCAPFANSSSALQTKRHRAFTAGFCQEQSQQHARHCKALGESPATGIRSDLISLPKIVTEFRHQNHNDVDGMNLQA